MYAYLEAREIISASIPPRGGHEEPCSELTIIKQSTRHYNTGNLLEKRASAGNYDTPPSPRIYVAGRAKGEREINEIPFARAGWRDTMPFSSPRRVDRMLGRMRQPRQGNSTRLDSSLLLALLFSSLCFALYLAVYRRRQLLRRYFNPPPLRPPPGTSRY